MTPLTLSFALLALLFGLAVLGAVAIGSLLIWVIVVAWRHITAPGATDERLDGIEQRLDDVEDIIDAIQDAGVAQVNPLIVPPAR